MRTPNPGLIGSIVTAIACSAAPWSPDGIAAGASGSRPGDASMTCQQIAMELQPYMQQLSPSITALGQTAQQVKTRGEERNKQAAAESAAETAEARATMLDPTGLSSKLLGQAQVARQKERWKRAEAEDKPLNEKYKTQTEQAVKQGQQMQSDARLQRLMQLAQEKNCQ